MERRTIGWMGTWTAVALLAQAAPASAGSPPPRGVYGDHDRDDHHGHYDGRDRDDRYYRHRDYDRDHRYYGPRGHVVRYLPRGYRYVRHYGDPYYYYGGVWYRPYGTQFVTVAAPVGVVIDRYGVTGYVSAGVPIIRW
jgi:hypothetical protein